MQMPMTVPMTVPYPFAMMQPPQQYSTYITDAGSGAGTEECKEEEQQQAAPASAVNYNSLGNPQPEDFQYQQQCWEQ